MKNGCWSHQMWIWGIGAVFAWRLTWHSWCLLVSQSLYKNYHHSHSTPNIWLSSIFARTSTSQWEFSIDSELSILCLFIPMHSHSGLDLCLICLGICPSQTFSLHLCTASSDKGLSAILPINGQCYLIVNYILFYQLLILCAIRSPLRGF